MPLLQIHEPNQTPEPHSAQPFVGIDLGTTHSLVATLRHGLPTCLPDELGHTLLPSVVHYASSGAVHVGSSAQACSKTDSSNVIASVKRLMGRTMSEIAYAQALSYELEPDSQLNRVRIKTAQGLKSPEEVSAEILKALKQRAESSLGDEVQNAIITVPAYFDETQRQATQAAAQLAGLQVLRLLNEPTAAALAYGLEENIRGLYIVYDLGGGTFDISVLALEDGIFEVRGLSGDTALGGDDFDRVLYAHFCKTLQIEPLNSEDKLTLLTACRALKEELSTQNQASRVITNSQQELQLKLSRREFETLTQHLLDKTLAILNQVTRDLDIKPDDISGLILVGGATRMPMVKAATQTWLLGREPLASLNPDEVVAIGAARQAAQLMGQAGSNATLLLDVIPLSLGIETMGGLVERIIPRHQTLPISMAQDFTTYQDGQTALALHVVQGERDLVEDCRSLARFELRGIPPMTAGAARIRVTFNVDANGLLTVEAKELSSGVEAQITIKPSSGLSEEELQHMLQDGITHANEDVKARAHREAVVEATRMRDGVLNALSADQDLLDEPMRQSISNALDALKVALQATDHHTAAELETLTQHLAKASEPFAAARMNRSIQRALTGQQLKDL